MLYKPHYISLYIRKYSLQNKNRTFTCVDTVPQLSAHNSGIIVIPAIWTHCSPHSIDADLHSASTPQRSINQTKAPISAMSSSCEEKWHIVKKLTLLNESHNKMLMSPSGRLLMWSEMHCYCLKVPHITISTLNEKLDTRSTLDWRLDSSCLFSFLWTP